MATTSSRSIPSPAPRLYDDLATACDSSTAPTTPEGSLSFSPIIRPRQGPPDGLEDDPLTSRIPNGHRPLSSALLDGTSGGQTPLAVRNICCIGAGWVGGPTAAVIAYHNPHITVAVVDKDSRRIRRWNSRHLPIFEPGLPEIVRVARDGSRECTISNLPLSSSTPTGIYSEVHSTSTSETSSQCESDCYLPTLSGSRVVDSMRVIPARAPNLFFSTDVAGCISDADIILIAVNTPTKTRGAGAGAATDMAFLEGVIVEVAQHARPGAIIVEKSTVPCRTSSLILDTLATHRRGVHFEVLSNPEFLAAGTAIKDLLYPDRILIGSAPTHMGRRASDALAGVYEAWIPRENIVTTNVFSSELAKLVANSMLAQRISSINSIAAICERTGADVDEIAGAIGRDERIGPKFLKAGIGFGGSCFKKDILSLVYLAETLGLHEVADYWRAVVTMNDFSRDRFAMRVVRALHNTLLGKKVALLGYAFKGNTSDTRESAALGIIKTFLAEGPKEIAVYDPCCNRLLMERELRTMLTGAEGVEGGKVLAQDGGPVRVYDNPYEATREADALLLTTEWDEFRTTSLPLAQVAKRKDAPGAGRASGRQDPRPFVKLDPSEADVLALHRFLAQPMQALTDYGSYSDSSMADPLRRFVEQPGCDSDCPDCATAARGFELTGARGSPSDGAAATVDGVKNARTRLDWAKILYHMKKPKWVFDGKGLVDGRELARLGARVESVGKQGRF